MGCYMRVYEETFKNFLRVRDHLLEEMNGDPYSISAQAYRKCFSLPLMFYKDKGFEACIKEIKAMVNKGG